MTWKITKKDLHTFPRNTIKLTIIQLRFQPILKISEKIPDFQENVRGRFPKFEEGMVRTIKPMLPEGFEVKEERQFRFISIDEKAILGLGPAAVYLESHTHKSRHELFQDMNLAVEALKNIYSPIVSSRIGMRYINEIHKDLISNDLGEELQWYNIINKEYLSGPSSLAGIEDTLMSSQIRSKVNGGMLTLRYGLIGDLDNPTYTFDIDRYNEGNFDLDKLKEILDAFADDIYSLYLTVVGKSLEKWLTKPNGGE